MRKPGLRQRLTRGAQAQAFGHLVRVIIQVAGVPILISSWGLGLYGEWLILAAIPTYLTLSDLGMFAAATNDMIMKVERDDRQGALSVFRSVSNAISLVFGLVAILLFALTWIAPVQSWLNLSILSESSASLILLVLGLNVLVMNYAGVLYGGFACEGRYGEGAFWLASVTLIEFLGLASVALLGGDPLAGAIGMFSARSVATTAMYLQLRRRVPWLSLGRSPGAVRELKRLVSPAVATGAFPAGFALNVQGMVILVGVVMGPVSAAIFSTFRTMSRVVIQLLASIFSVISPEISKAYAAKDYDLLRKLHRYGCQASVWLSAPIVLVLAIFGNRIVEIWTSGQVHSQSVLLYLFLAVTVIDSLWFTSLAVMFATNRHQRLALCYFLASVVALPCAYLLMEAWGLDGAAVSLLMIEVFMLFVVLREVLPEAHDTLRDWLRAIVKPPLYLADLLRVRRRRVALARFGAEDPAPSD
jgi:O-antigen/teichoic acid export membrane protein